MYKAPRFLFRWLLPLVSIVLLGLLQAQGQSVANYTPAYSTGITYSSISGAGNSVAFWRNNVANQNDDNRSNPINIGFDFWYLGVRYTTVSISTNGFVDFSGAIYDGNASSGPGVVNCGGAIAYRQSPVAFSTSGCAATPPTSYSGTYIALAPLYTDLWVSGGTAALANSIKYLTTGTAPNRVFTAEYITFDDFAAGVANLNFQVKIYETTGKIEFVYGSMVGSSGSTTTNYTLGINASTMSATPTAAQLLVQQTENTSTFSNAIKNNLTNLPVSNSLISFTPVTPANPSGSLTFTGVTNTDMTLNWTDWATNELGYVIYSSTDGISYSFARQVAANSTSATFNNLYGSTYYWRVYAVTEGALSSALSGSQSTLPGATFVSAQTGPWNTGSTWVGGFVPTPGDNALISTGHTVTVDGNVSITNITINGTLAIGNNATARTFTVLGDGSISSTGSFTSGSAATHSMILQGNFTNNGTFNMSPGGGSITNVTFNKNGNQTFDGTGATTNFNNIILNTGNSSSNVVDFKGASFSAPTDFLTLQNGSFKFSVTSAVTLNLFPAGTTILPSSGIIMNSSLSTMNMPNTISFQGDLTVNAGNVFVGDAADENLVSNGSDIIINGGKVEIAGRLTRPSYVSLTNFTMTGGTLICNTFGSNDSAPPAGTSAAGPFTIDVIGSKFIMSGGTIIIRQSGAGGTGNLGYTNNNVTNYSFTGGTIQIGDALTPAANSMKISADQPIYNLSINTTNSPTALLTSALTVNNTTAISSGATLNTQNFNLTQKGAFANDGTYTPGTNTTTFAGNSDVLGATITTFNNVTITGTLNGHISNMNVNGNWTSNGGTFNGGTGAVTFTGAGAQAINGTSVIQTFNDIVVNKAAGTVTVGGSTTTMTLNNYTQTAGNMTFMAGGLINVAGNWTHNAGTFTPSTSTVNFNGTGAQQITSTALALETFYAVSVNKTAGTLLSSGGTLTALTFTNDYTQATGDFTPPATLNVGRNWTHNAGSFNPGSGTVNFNGTVAQTISSTALLSETFYNLTVTKTAGTLLNTGGTITTINVLGNYLETQGNFTPPATLSIAGNLTVTAGTLTAGTLIDLKGNWAHNGGTFTAGTSTVSFTGAAGQQISNQATETFYNFTINKTAGTLLNTAANPTTIVVQNNFTQTLGDFTPPANLNIGGNYTHDGGTFTPGTGTVTFNGTGSQVISSASFGTESFYNLTVNKASGTVSTGANPTTIAIANNYTQTQGNFNAPATVTIGANATLTAGTLTAGNLIDIKGNWTNNGATFAPATSTVTFTGTGAQAINGTAVSQTFYNLTINKTAGQTLTTGGSTATLNIQNNYTQTQGNFTPIANGTTNVGGNWSHDAGTFTPNTGTVNFNGSGAELITSSLLATETFYRLSITKTAGTLLSAGGSITTISATNNYTQTQGDFTPPATLNVGGNWTHDAGSFNPGTGTVVFNGGGAQVMSSAALTSETFYNLTVNKGGGALSSTIATINVGNNFTNTLGTSNAPTNFNVTGNIVLSGGTFVGGTSFIDLKGNWAHNGGTFTPTTSTLNFSGTGAQQITNQATETFYNLTINKTLATLLNTGANPTTITVQNNFTQTQGDFTPPATLNIGGNWSHESGAFNFGTGTVVFNGAGAQSISNPTNATETFYNLTINKTAATLLSTGTNPSTINVNNNFVNTQGNFNTPVTMNVTGSFTLTAGTLTGSSLIDVNGAVTLNGGTLNAPTTMNVGGGWSKAAAAVFTPGSGTVVFDGSGAQTIGGTTVTQVFNNFIINKTAGSTLNTGGSTTGITTLDFTQTQGNFTAPATVNINGNTLLTAGTYTAGTNTNVAGNWTRNGGTFTPGANTVSFVSTSGQVTVGGGLSTTFGRLTVNSTSPTIPQVALALPQTVNTQLTMTSGILNTSAANKLILASGSTVNIGSASSYIDGPMQYNMAINAVNTTLNFPIGKAGNYGAASLIVRHTSATSYSYIAEMFNSSALALGYTLAPGTTKVSEIRYLDIRREATATPGVTDNSNLQSVGVNAPRLTMYYVAADYVSDPTNLTMVKTKSATPNTWFDIGGTATGSPAGNIAMAVSSANFDSFSYFALANKTGGSNALPITLRDFTGRQDGHDVLLEWHTESEIRNQGFEIEKLFDEGFHGIGTVKGAGNSTTLLRYEFRDKQPANGRSYYRLKQVDFDGTGTYSRVIAVDVLNDNERLNAVPFPNPSGNEQIDLQLTIPDTSQPAGIMLSDLNGKVIGRYDITPGGPTHQVFTMKMTAPLSSGIYLVRISSGNQTFVSKVVVK